MKLRLLLIGAAALVVGVLGGLAVSEWVLRDEAPPGTPGAPEAGPTPAPAETEPIRIGEPDPEPPPEVPELRTLNDLFTTVAERAAASVVYLRVEGPGTVPDDGFHDDVGPVPQRSQTGSGVIITSVGHVVTNAHVVQGGSRIQVLLQDKREFEAELVGTDPTTDLAVVRLLEVRVGDEDDPLPVATLGDSDRLRVGEWVMAIGSPFRLTGTVTQGIVSALGRQVDIIEDNFRIEDFIQTDAAINPGNSGGALVNLRGEVVGIATAIATEGGGYEGYGFAVPINLAARVAQDLIERGEVERGYLGVEIRPVTAADARELGMRRIEGILVEGIARGGAAERSGLRTRDVLLAVDGSPVNAPNQFQSRLALHRPGESVRVDIWRDGQRQALSVRLIGRDDPVFRQWLAELGDRRAPEPAPEAPEDVPPDVPRFEAEDWGVRFRDLTSAERRTFGVSAGAFVERVESGSAAEVDGLPVGTVVTRVEQQEVTSAEEARAALAALARRGDPALLRVRRADGLTAFYELVSPFVD
ncbi:MAG TPA: trypsin-like peptidase domain-containing protein [Rubricoccaceae bacterium]|nr:trypsin-like peptidase domain-containing protein [Rubricoccaceae bacterium]